MKYLLLLLVLLTISARADIQVAIDVYQQGDNQQAEEMFLTLQDQPAASIYLARIWQDKDLDKAEYWITRALKQAPQNPEAHFVKGSVMANQASNSSFFSAYGYAKDALKAFKQAVELAPDNVQFRLGLMQFYSQAPGIVGGSKEQALRQVVAIERLHPIKGIKARLRFYHQTGNNAEYDRLLFEARQQHRDKADFHYLAAMHHQDKQQYSLAMTLLEKASVLPSCDPEASFDQFNALYQVGRTAVLAGSHIETGIEALQQYIEQAPNSRQLPEKYWARFRLANLFELSGDTDRARHIYQSLLSIGDKQLSEEVKKHLKQS